MASTFKPVSPLAGVNLDATIAGTGSSSDQGGAFAVGTQCRADNGGLFEYVHAAAAITAYDFVAIDEDGEVQPITTALAQAGYRIGVAQVAFSDNDFGWVALTGHGGNYKGRVGASCAADAALNTTATAGVLDDDGGGQTIDGVVITTAADASGAQAEEIITAAGGMFATGI